MKGTVFQYSFWIRRVLGLSFLFLVWETAPAPAMEISQITPAKATEPACRDSTYYIEQVPPGMVGVTPESTCTSCKTQIGKAVETANNKLTLAAQQDAGITASATASTQGSAAVAGANQFQNDHMFKTGDVNQTGLAAAKQQEALAQQVATGYDQCVSDIQSACSNVAPSDKGMVEQAKQSCTASANQARGVAADKAAKAAQMAENGQQANQNGQGMQPPQMPQGGGGGSGLGSSDPYGSNISSTIDKAKTAKLDSGFSGGKTDIPLNQSSESGLSSQKFTPETPGGASSASASSEDSKNSTGGTSSGAASTVARNGVSSSGTSMSGSGFGDSSKSSSEESGAARNPAAKSDEGEGLASGAAPAFKPTLGLRSSGTELNELLQNPAGATGSETVGGRQEAAGHSENPKNLAAVGEEVSLFQRIRTKITVVSRARHMQ